MRVNNQDIWWPFFLGNGANNWIYAWEIMEYLQNHSGTGVGHHTVHGDFVVYEDFSCHGTKNRITHTADFGERKLYCYETASPMFGEVGEGKIAEDGICIVELDPVFEETVTTGQYQVFLQPYGAGTVYVAERGPHSFTVRGTPGMLFGWEIKAKQKDFAQLRMEEDLPWIDEPGIDYSQTDVVPDYGASAAEYIQYETEAKLS